MGHGFVSVVDMARFNRADVAFLLLVQEHQPLVDALLTRLDREGMIALANSLPPAVDALRTVACTRVPLGPNFLDIWTRRQSTRLTDLAVYCAAASRQAAAKILTEVKARAEESKRDVQRLRDLTTLARTRGIPELHAALWGDTDATTQLHPQQGELFPTHPLAYEEGR